MTYVIGFPHRIWALESGADVEVEPGFDREWALVSVLCMTVLAALWMRWHLKPVEVVG